MISRSGKKEYPLHLTALSTLVAGLNLMLPAVHAEEVKLPGRPKYAIDDERWVTLGMGFRGSGRWAGNKAADRVDERFIIDNARFYVNGQVHKYVKFEINTECFFCGNTHPADRPRLSYTIMDAVGKLEFNRYFNIWGGRVQVPTERGELSGPFFQATHDASKTPLFSQDFSTKFGVGGAGLYGRDDGGTFWGNLEPGFVHGTLHYAMGVYRGLISDQDFGPNQGGNILWAGRFAYNFWNLEKNRGYYTSSTYFGKAGDILTLGFGTSFQKDGAGSFAHRSNFLGLVGDALLEKVLPRNLGVVTAVGEYKQFYANYSTAAFKDSDCFCIFDGKSWTITGLYLMPTTLGIGKFQPYGRYTRIQPNHSSTREEIEGGVNYIIDDFNARISAYYQRGDLFTKGSNYGPTVAGPKVDVFKLSFQLQM